MVFAILLPLPLPLPLLPLLLLFLRRVSPVEEVIVAVVVVAIFAFSSEVTAISKLSMIENNGSKFDLRLVGIEVAC